jgi:single-stranded DNA-binding protein
MQSQLYLSGRVAAAPELLQTQKGKFMVRLLLETEAIRETGLGNYQTETSTLPISFFSREAEEVRDALSGDHLVVGCHLYGTKFEASDGSVKHGVKIYADQVLHRSATLKETR